MLTQIRIERFKCFEHFYMPLKPLTMIVGPNGAGKSSVIQTLLLLRQSCKDKDTDWHEQVVLNGDLVKLDKATSLLYYDASGDNTDIEVAMENDSDKEITFRISTKENGDNAECHTEGDLEEAKANWPLFDNNFVYLYADREQPREKYVKSRSTRLDSRLGNIKGNNAAFLLTSQINNNGRITLQELKHKNAADDLVMRNVSAWVSYIMGSDVSVTATETEKDKEAKVEYIVYNKSNVSLSMSPMNMAFGHSYILPIVLGILTAPKGSLFIVENPESHLHPSAQRKMGEFLSRAAAAGVQVLIETHSDHLMNGIRLACRNKIIDNEDVEMDLIDIDNSRHIRKPIILNADGTLKNWIPGFFDEWEKALGEFM